MKDTPQNGFGTLTIIASAMLLVALAAPCALPNRIVAAGSVIVALLSIGSILYGGYKALQRNRRELERDTAALAARNQRPATLGRDAANGSG